MRAGLLGCILTPKQGNRLPPDAQWCADNGAFGKGYPGDSAWLAWLASYPLEARQRCAFAVAPDVVGEAAATATRSAPWLPVIRYALGYPVAYVAQDGLEHLDVPWDQFDVLFIGGTTAWKLSHHAHVLIEQAKAHGKNVHMGRVNSHRRITAAHLLGCDSTDGTYIKFGPDVNLPKVLSWLSAVNNQTDLFDHRETT